MEVRPFRVRVEARLLVYRRVVKIDVGIYQLGKRRKGAKKEGEKVLYLSWNLCVPRPENAIRKSGIVETGIRTQVPDRI